MKIMAIDYGDAHTGIAISDYTETLAGHSEVLHSRKQEEVLAGIRRLIAEHDVKLLVLGYPRNMDGSEGPRAEKCAAFGELLWQETGLEVILWDERRTTIDAHQILMSSGKNAKKRKKVVDAVAASLILEGYLTYLKTHPVAAGVSGTFGDSLPIEGLIEATNETAKVGKVTGVLADALNWVGISEDKMNERLERTSSEAERNRILLETLTGSYDDAADAFYRNNEQLVQARKNQAALSAMTAKLGNASAIAKNSLMRLFGVQEDGSIRAGSALAWLNDRAESVLAKFQEWSQDGTMDDLAQKLDQGLAKAGEMAGNAFQWVLDHGDTIKRWVVGLGTALTLVKVAQFASGVMNAVKTVKLFATTVGTIVATNPVVLAIVAAIAAISLLVANWDKVKAKAGELWDGIKTVFGGIKDSIVGAFNSAKEAVGSFFSWIGDKLSALDGAIESVPVIGSIYRGIKGAGSWVIDKVTGHATGTSYFPGGWTRVNERGGEIMRLPGGTQIIPHDVSRRMAGGTTVQVYVTVQGNVIGNQAYAESLGETIAQKLLRALRNR